MRRLFLVGLTLIGAAWPGHSQLLSFGVEAGIPLNDAVNGISSGSGIVTSNTDRWTIGPTLQLHLPFRLSAEVDALYRSEGYSITSPNLASSFSINNWQFPILAKYDLNGGLLRPFVDAGITYRHLSGDGSISNSSSAGFTIGGGLTLKLLFIRLSPEIRYTRWNNSPVFNTGLATQSQDQTDFLVGFTF